LAQGLGKKFPNSQVGERISGSTVPEEQGNSEGKHFLCDDEIEAEACRRVQTLSHYFFPAGIKRRVLSLC
jgi:hypothetical protein